MLEWDRINQLMQQRGVTPYKLSKDTGIAQSNFTAWKTGPSKPGLGAIARIADYFGVDSAYLRGETDTPSTGTEKSPVMDDETLEMAMLFERLTPESRKPIITLLQQLTSKVDP